MRISITVDSATTPELDAFLRAFQTRNSDHDVPIFGPMAPGVTLLGSAYRVEVPALTAPVALSVLHDAMVNLTETPS